MRRSDGEGFVNSPSRRPPSGLPFSRRMAFIEASGVRRIFDLAQQARRRGTLIDLSLGQPDFHAPPAAARAALRAVREEADRYTVTQGLPELLAALRRKLGRSRPVDGLIVTAGASGGLTLA